MPEKNTPAPAPAGKRPYGIQMVLCDDNKPYLKELRKMVRAVTTAQSIDATIWAFDDADNIPKNTLQNSDVFILDIDFPEKNYSGIDLARTVRRQNPNAIIVFISNYIQFAPDGYEVQAFRYILKSEVPQKLEMCIMQAIEMLRSVKESMCIKVGGEVLCVNLRDIVYLEAQGHQVTLHTQKPGAQSEKTYTCYTTLAKLWEEYSDRGFLRIQKSYLVNARRISSFQCNEAVMDTGKHLPVSKKNYAEQKRQYLYWKGNNTWNM